MLDIQKGNNKKLNTKISDLQTIEDFGDEWIRFNQQKVPISELNDQFNSYFVNFPWEKINKNSVGFDAGSGSGRWAYFVSSKVKILHCIEPSNAIEKSKKLLLNKSNCIFHKSSIKDLKLKNETMDFGFSIGVLHHTEDPQENLNACVNKLKKGSPFLLYLYYSLEDTPIFYKILWKLSDYLRKIISKFPFKTKILICDLIAITVYLPLARFAFFLNIFKIPISYFPLSFYYNKSLFTMRTDSLDRFGTKVEYRYLKKEFIQMMKNAGLDNIIINKNKPFWTGVGTKK